MTAIDDKHRQLKRAGVDLGPARSAERSASSGGRSRNYQHGMIYWHANTGAHEVHGAILATYKRLGGPAANPKTGRRELGYPTSDEHRTPDRKHPKSEFEWGSITWVSGHGAGVVTGDLHKYWMLTGEAEGPLGHPISFPLAVPGGQAAFFEYGCIFSGGASGGAPLHCALELPRIGQPHVAVPEARKLIIPDVIRLTAPPRFRGSLSTLRRALALAWKGRLALRPTKNTRAATIPLKLTRTTAQARGGSWSLGTDTDLADRTLYDIVFVPASGTPQILAPHAVYVKRSWDRCGLMHVTDLHVSRRLEHFRPKLSGKSREAYVNYNDGVRSVIRHANKLYKQGKLDALLATGDLVDYIFEHDDSQLAGGNWDFFEKLIRGQAKGEGPAKAERLLVPIFMSAGNHDYRKHPYELLFDIDISLWPDPTVKNFRSHNLTDAEARRIQGGKKLKFGKDGAVRMVAIDKDNRAYFRRMVRDPSYVVHLGKHRVVMIDSRWDAGMLTGTWDAIKTKAGFGSHNQRNFADGHPNSEGFTKGDVALVDRALAETKRGGVVIVGVHAPPVNTAGNEYAHFFRETARASTDLDEVRAFLMRQASWVGAARINTRSGHSQWRFPKGWLGKGQRYFKKGGRKGVDYGISKGKIDDFLKLCTGHGAARPVDLVLSGHVHKNVEYRLEWDERDKFRFYMDFYTETPRSFYPSKSKDGKLYINVVPGASVGGRPSPIKDHRSGGFADHEVLSVPPYADPLESSSQPKAWWRKHRPLIVQTASSGPMDSYQRLDKDRHMPSPSFRGVRLLTIAGDVIHRIDYVTIDEIEGGKRPSPPSGPPPGKPPPKPKPGKPKPAKPAKPPSKNTNVIARRGTVSGTSTKRRSRGKVRDHRKKKR